MPATKSLLALSAVFSATLAAMAGDQPQWGHAWTRNQVSAETGLPESFDPKTARNLKWSVPLGSECYATPVIGQGKVLIGTNNREPRDPKHQGDRGVLFCLDERDGSLAWQLVVPKLDWDIFLDWPNAGICSPPTVEGNRVYLVTNRAEVVCLDLKGMADGNQGPFLEEGRHAAPPDQPALEPGRLDADILWLLDLRAAAGVRPHDSSHGSILVDGPLLYVNTSNGLNSKHQGVEKPEAPSLVVIDKASGRLVATDGQKIGPRIFHCTWSSPAMAEVNGRRLVFFCGGDGVVYAFEPWKPSASDKGVGVLNLVWRYDTDPASPKEDIHRYIRNRRESPSTIQSMPVFHENRLYITRGGDIWWGKHKSWLECIDTRGSGDVTASAAVWSLPIGRHTCSTPALDGGLVYAADCDGQVHCADAGSGKPYWLHDAGGEIWASPLVADGKVYVGTRRGDFLVFAAGKEKRLLSSLRLDSPIHSTAVAANGVLYVGTMTRLYAVEKK